MQKSRQMNLSVFVLSNLLTTHRIEPMIKQIIFNAINRNDSPSSHTILERPLNLLYKVHGADKYCPVHLFENGNLGDCTVKPYLYIRTHTHNECNLIYVYIFTMSCNLHICAVLCVYSVHIKL